MLSPGMIAGSMVASFVSDKFGRRITLLTSAAPYVVGTVSTLRSRQSSILL